jgi:hypothetical protein
VFHGICLFSNCIKAMSFYTNVQKLNESVFILCLFSRRECTKIPMIVSVCVQEIERRGKYTLLLLSATLHVQRNKPRKHQVSKRKLRRISFLYVESVVKMRLIHEKFQYYCWQPSMLVDLGGQLMSMYLILMSWYIKFASALQANRIIIQLV